MRPFAAVLFLFLFANASQCQPKPEVARIELSKISRGYQEHVRLTPDSVNVLVESSLNPSQNTDYGRTITESDWVALVQTLDGIKLSDIPKLPSPTMNRATDAAKHSTITITTKDGKEYSHGFDDENPNVALRELVRRIREVSGRDRP
jgi:hypothetical protein